jgi:hypothetical protein
MASPHAAGTAALCISAGQCTGMPPSYVINKLRFDASVQPSGYGFDGDPNPVASRYYGYLIYAGGY